MTPEQMAEEMFQEVRDLCELDLAAAELSDGLGDIRDAEREWVDVGITAGYTNTLRMLIRRGLLASTEGNQQ